MKRKSIEINLRAIMLKAIEMANKVDWNTAVKDNVLKGWLNFKQVLFNIQDQCIP